MENVLADLQVLQDDGFGLHRRIGTDRGASLWCFNDRQVVLVLITPDALHE